MGKILGRDKLSNVRPGYFERMEELMRQAEDEKRIRELQLQDKYKDKKRK